MLLICLLFVFLSIFTIFLAFIPINWDNRPTLNLENPASLEGVGIPLVNTKKKNPLWIAVSKVAIFNKPLVLGFLGRRMGRDLGMAQVGFTPEEFLLIKEILIAFLIWSTLMLTKASPDLLFFCVLMSFAVGYFLPDLWLKARIGRIKNSIMRDLPDTVDLLGLCVNAGLDFMMALKYVIEKSHSSVIVDELRAMMQEINVGKPRRDALRDMARKYELPDLSTFSRTLIQADRMGTSVSEALNILSEDMREARFRRGESIALKAPLKMLIPLLFFIFPVVAILVAGPVFLDFFQNNPLQNLGK